VGDWAENRSSGQSRAVSLDALVLVVLVLARLRIDTLTDLVAPRPEATVRHLPLIGGLLSQRAWDLMRNWLTDPLSLLLVVLTFTLLAAYLLIDALRARFGERRAYRAKLGLLLAIVATTVLAQSGYLILMRHATGPASFAHDGGVIQTEAATSMFLDGRNPYAENYGNTPLADWGLEKRTAIYHYPYLPWTFVASAPAMMASNWILGWWDQRFLYLALFAVTLALLPGLAGPREDALLLVGIVGLNPIMGNDIIFGMNDSFVLAWLVLGLWLARRQRFGWAALAMGLAWASKSTAWFFLPFYLLYMARGASDWRQRARQVWRRLWPALVVVAVLVLPYLMSDPGAFYDDIWAWSAGTSATSYQIRGWGLSNLVLAFGLVRDTQAFFPFWPVELLVCLPVLVATLRLQWQRNDLRRLIFGAAVLFGAYSFVSRFFNENYAGLLLSLLALAALAGESLGGTEASVDGVEQAGVARDRLPVIPR
jgi:hypothetical protein